MNAGETQNVGRSRAAIVLDVAPGPHEELPFVSGPTALFVPSAGSEVEARLCERFDAVVTSEDLVTPAIGSEAMRAVPDAIESIWQVPVAVASLDEKLRYEGIRLADVAHSHLAYALADALVRLCALDEWWKRERPGELYVPARVGQWSHAAVLLARELQIPTRRLSGYPPTAPMWPLRRSSIARLAPDFLRRWRDRREARSEAASIGRRKPALPAEGGADVLALAHYPAEARALEPIMRRIIADGGCSVALSVDQWGGALRAAERSGLPFSLMQDCGDWREAAARVTRNARCLGRLWHRALRSPTALGIKHRGVSVPLLVRDEWGAMGELSLRQDCLRQYLWWIEMVRRAMEYWSPKVVLVADEAMPINVIQMLLAETAGTASVHVPHGAILEHPKHRACTATRIAVGGDAVRRFLVSLGTDSERIVTTGSPQFDSLADREALDAAPIRDDLGIPSDRPVVVYTMLSGQGVTPREDVIAATEEVLAACREMSGEAAFVFKRHPADRANILEQMGADTSALGAIVTYDAPIHPLLMVADVVVTQMSTTGQEALMLGKSLAVVNLSGRDDSIPYVAYGAAVPVNRSGALADAIRLALTDDATRSRLRTGRDEFVRDFAYRVDGRATERVVDEIAELVGRCRPSETHR